MKINEVPVTHSEAQSDIDWADTPNVYAAARAARSRFIGSLLARVFGKRAETAPNADGLAPLGLTR